MVYNIGVDKVFGGVLSAVTEYLINTQIHASEGAAMPDEAWIFVYKGEM